jgi:hypothetical protein
MTHYIFGRVKNKSVWFVGCSRTADLPGDSILLQTVQHHPDVHWVKWSLRFASTLEDKMALSHPYAKYFKNSARTKRLFGDPDMDRFSREQNARFLKFHASNPHLLEELIRAALAKKAEGKTEYSMDQLLGDVRWGDTEIDRADDRVKINGTWSAWYSRVVQMVETRLVGFFTVRYSVADELVWAGQSWQQFALEHEEEIHWSDPFDQLPDSDWEYKG